MRKLLLLVVAFVVAATFISAPAHASWNPQPIGPTGTWQMVWHDGFNEPQLDTSKWYVFDNVVRQGVVCHASNLSVANGVLNVKLASSNSGAEINSWGTQGATNPPNGYGLAYGDAVEARVWVPGPVSHSGVPNWPSFWASGHPSAGPYTGGEIDILENLSGNLHIDYNNANGDRIVGPAPAGAWAGGWHTYTAVRNGPASNASYDVYWDGKLVWHTAGHNEQGSPEDGILLTNGYSAQWGGPLKAPSTMKVDYVRIWTPG